MADFDDPDEDDGAPPLDDKATLHINPGGGDVASGDLTPEEMERFNIKGQLEHAARLQGVTAGPLQGVEPDPRGGLRSTTPPAVADDALARALVAKFPDFNPGWKDDLKKQWFAGYADLMKMIRG